jgi:hypothetical protein
MILSVKTLVGEVCMTREDGQKLHDAFRPLLDAGEPVSLDFSETRIFTTAFFNAAVGQLLEAYTKDELSNRLGFKNVPQSSVGPLKNSIETADRYYRDPTYRAALDKVLKDQAELV